VAYWHRDGTQWCSAHAFAHIITTKPCLFMSAGVVYFIRTGKTKCMDWAVIRTMPITTACELLVLRLFPSFPLTSGFTPKV